MMPILREGHKIKNQFLTGAINKEVEEILNILA